MNDKPVAYVGRWWCWKTYKVFWRGVIEQRCKKTGLLGMGQRLWSGTKVYDDEPFDVELVRMELEEAANRFQATKTGWIWDDHPNVPPR